MAVNLTRQVLVDGWRSLQFALLPAHCLLCGQAGAGQRDLCDGCAAQFVRNAVSCPRCALPLAAPAPLCGECLRREPRFATAYAPFIYCSPLDQLITRLKFGRNLAAGRVLAEVWIDAWSTAPPRLPEALIPVPLHAQRLRERGYNQALELARPLAAAWRIPLSDNALVRTRSTPAQSNLQANQRRRNLRGAFSVATHAALPAHVALLDDVMTTGATLHECTRTLLRAGVERVDVWVLARAPKSR
jgi:ComF family protein